MFIVEIILWLGIGLIIHSYVIYPKLVQYFARFRKTNELTYSDDFPHISIIIPAHNEEKVIRQKLETILQTNFAFDRIQLLVGADNCQDETCEIIRSYESKFPDMKLIEFQERQGKINVVNKLVQEAKGEGTLTIPLNKLKAGTYVINVESATKIWNKPLIIK